MKLLKEHKIFLVVLAAAIFFRTYAVIERYDYAHDGDLFSWIVKDIVVDRHPRLIGQLTTAPGIFIGPLFYYLLIPFFLLTNMDPVGAIIPIVIFGVATVVSYYWVFTNLWNKKVGLIASFLYAVLLTNVSFDSRVVPSTPTNIWIIWYFYTVIQLARGNLRVFPLLGLLIGLIWHIHVALAPALSGAFFALVFSRKLPKAKEIFLAFIVFATVSIPLLLFEVRHNFSQTLSFIQNLSVDYGGGTGIDKFNLILFKFSDGISRLFFYPQGVPYPQGWPFNKITFVALLLLIGLLLAKKKIIKVKELLVLYGWLAGVIVYFSVSSVVVSEYYLASVEIIFLTIVSLGLYAVSKKWKLVVVVLLVVIFFKNAYHHVTVQVYQAGYDERRAVAEFIVKDSKEKDFPCVSISYITGPGDNVGFRYFFWLNNLKTKPVKTGGPPVYTIVFPSELVTDDLAAKFGQIGIIRPEKQGTKEEIEESCSGENSNLTDPMFGFTK